MDTNSDAKSELLAAQAHALCKHPAGTHIRLHTCVCGYKHSDTQRPAQGAVAHVEWHTHTGDTAGTHMLSLQVLRAEHGTAPCPHCASGTRAAGENPFSGPGSRAPSRLHPAGSRGPRSRPSRDTQLVTCRRILCSGSQTRGVLRCPGTGARAGVSLLYPRPELQRLEEQTGWEPSSEGLWNSLFSLSLNFLISKTGV